MASEAKHKKLIEAALAAVRAVHADVSVSKERNAESLKEIKEECQQLIDSLEE